MKIKPVVLNFINFVLKNDYGTILKTRIGDTIRVQTERLLERYFKHYVNDKPLKSLEFLKTMKDEA